VQSRVLNAAAGWLVFANWAFFLTVTLLICAQAGNIAWLADLHWGSFLTDLSGLLQLGAVPAGSVWIAWLLLSLCFFAAWLLSITPATAPKPIPAAVASPPPNPVELRQGAIEAQPEVQEKLRRLNRWLSQA